MSAQAAGSGAAAPAGQASNGPGKAHGQVHGGSRTTMRALGGRRAAMTRAHGEPQALAVSFPASGHGCCLFRPLAMVVACVGLWPR